MISHFQCLELFHVGITVLSAQIRQPQPFTQTLSFNALTSIEGEQCRQHRKRCIRSRVDNKCDRCIKRNFVCSLQDGITGFIRHYNMDCRESMRAFLHMLRSIQSLENQISSVEMQLQQQPWKQLDSQSTVSNDRESFNGSNWELTIHSSHSQKLTLNVHIQRTEGKSIHSHQTRVIRYTDMSESRFLTSGVLDILRFINNIYTDLATSIPRPLSNAHHDVSVFVPCHHLRFPLMLLQCLKEPLERDSWRQVISLDLQMSALNSNQQLFTPILAEVFFDCRYHTAPLIHPEYYNQNQDNPIGNHLKVVIGCLLAGRNCIKSPLYDLPRKTQLRQLSYYMGRCTEQIDQLMMLDSPPLSLSLSLLTLALTNVYLMNARKAWLLMATARTYLLNHMEEFFDSIMDKDGPTNPELETYKLALHLCATADEKISYITQNHPAQSIISFDEMLLLPKPVLGDNLLRHSIAKQSFLWYLTARRSNFMIDSSTQFTGSTRVVNWDTIRQTNSDFTTWYIRLPSELKIGDNPFDIIGMDIPQDLDTSVACLQLAYYSEWCWVYGNVLNPNTSSEPSTNEASFMELKHMVFLASLSMVKVCEFLHKVEMCKIGYYRLLFACEPLLYLAKSTDSHIAYKSEMALKKALNVLKSLLQHNLFSPIARDQQENGNTIAFGQRLLERLNTLLSEYNMQFLV